MQEEIYCSSVRVKQEDRLTQGGEKRERGRKCECKERIRLFRKRTDGKENITRRETNASILN